MFSSIYPKPEITFAHVNGEQMTIEKITIKTPLIPKTGAFPMGEGLIFLSDTYKPFNLANIYSSWDMKRYNQWKEDRMKD
jgi:hypothetical protein